MEPGTNRPLKIGLLLPLGVGDGSTLRWRAILAMARRAEELGLDSLWAPDHLLFRSPGKETEGAWDCWSLLAALAAATRRVALGPLVSATGFRNPALLAKMADTVDEISGGRLILGLGAGWNKPEHAAFGYPFDRRVDRFEEALAIIRPLLREGRVGFKGTYYEARDCELRPRGPRPGGPPLLIGAYGERMTSLAAKHADSWNTWLSHCPEGLGPVCAAVDAACAAVGRDPASLARTVGLTTNLAGGGVPPELHTPGAPLLEGSIAEMAAALRAYARAGIVHVQLSLLPNTLAGLEAFAPVLALLDRG